MLGQSISHYRILRRLGSGGMGEVFAAEDSELGRKVALKVLPRSLATNPEALERFRREARALAALNHPNIVTIYSVEQAADTHFITMELVEGRPLGDLIPKGGLDVKQLFAFSIPLTDALAAAHARGIGHRDLKPSNVMVNDQGRVKVIDFGLAKLFQPETGVDLEAPTVRHTVDGKILGTPSYMSPEQIEGRKVDHRTDIFSLGVLLCEMATATRPFQGDSSMAIMSSILRDPPRAIEEMKTGLPEHLGRIVRRCLQKNPDDRYQNAIDVRNELKGLEEETNAVQRPQFKPPTDLENFRASHTEREKSGRKIPRWALAFATIILLALTGGIVWSKFPKTRNIGSTDRAGPRLTSIAVLPFKNFVNDTNKALFADMVTEEIIGKLGAMSAKEKNGAIRIISTPTMMSYKGTVLSIPAIAKELNADSLVSGSLTLKGTQVNLRIDLIDPAQDISIWSTNYIGHVDHLVQLQNEAALGISRAIHLTPTADEPSLAAGREVDSRALEAYTRGKYKGNSDKDNLETIQLLEEAVHIAPDFAAGHAALGKAYVDRYFWHVPEEHKVWEEKALLAMDQALKLDANLAEAHVTLALILWTPFKNFQHEAAMAELQLAAKLNPNSYLAHQWIAIIYLHTGLLDEGRLHGQRAAELNRLSPHPPTNLASTFLLRQEYEKSVQAWKKVVSRNYASYVGSHIAWAQLRFGQTNEAAATLSLYLKESPTADKTGELTAMNAILLIANGDSNGAIREIQNAKKRETGFGEFHHTAYLIAAAYALMDMHEDSLVWLQKAADTGFPCYSLFEKDPQLNSLRALPGFISFLSAQKKQWQERRGTWLKTDALIQESALR